MKIISLSASHHATSLDTRERLSFSTSETSSVLDRFTHRDIPELLPYCEFAILSTCNRTEVFACLADQDQKEEAGVQVFVPLLNFLANKSGIPTTELDPHITRYSGEAAVYHLCRVAAGLESMVLGEPQILGQVADAYETAQEHNSIGPVLSSLFRSAIRSGKRARTETGISQNPATISSVAIHLAEKEVGSLSERDILVIGAGEMAELAVSGLHAHGATCVTVVNRTQQRSADMAERWGFRSARFDRLSEVIQEADLVIASTNAPHALVTPELVEEAMLHRRQRPMVLIDISIPRNIDPDVASIPGARLYDIDNLQAYLNGSIAERIKEIPSVEEIVASEVHHMELWLHQFEILPTITDLRQKAEDIRKREVTRAMHHLPDADEQTRLQIEQLSVSLVNKLLHEPTLNLRSEALNGQAAEYAEVLRRLFGLTAEKSH
ncbi:MAG: glutamyl-tRNA reductase [Chloroflexi bacterium]|nr:glutamyl-tRNA reductase [Chloroflexota bacterium]